MAVSAVPEPASTSVLTVAILASASRAVSGQGAAVTLGGSFRWLTFEAVLSAVTGANSVRLYVQQSADGGTNWDDLWVLDLPTTGPGVQEVLSASFPVRKEDSAAESHVWTDQSMAVGVRDTVVARTFRVAWVITAGGPYTFQVLAHLR